MLEILIFDFVFLFAASLSLGPFVLDAHECSESYETYLDEIVGNRTTGELVIDFIQGTVRTNYLSFILDKPICKDDIIAGLFELQLMYY